ncbi:hypothetical protein [Bradyrhizobium sp.]|jgi:hypothetical protein|uniref:hypothetical protein n=1 Tax=Bradyrhizobium sp. TaxID=376 RepID=UPI003BAFC970
MNGLGLPIVGFIKKEQTMNRSNQGMVKDEKCQEQPADKLRAQTVHKTDPKHSVSREATRDSELSDANRTPRSRHDP